MLGRHRWDDRSVPALLERDVELDALRRAFECAGDGRGSAVLVSGEAGVGKTSLVRAFLETLPSRTRVLSGGGEDLLAPRSFGALREAVAGTGGLLEKAFVDNADADGVLAAAVAELRVTPAPTILVIDDAHWADGATLDVVRHLGRRIDDLPAVLVLTYRDDAVDPADPLRRALGAMTGAGIQRLRLPRLTGRSVDALARDVDVDPAELYRMTEGNPFFVTEVLASPHVDVPATVSDAVLARVGRLGPATRAAIERCAVVPSGIELDLLRVLQPDLSPIEDAERDGILTMIGRRIAFRHELARRAVVAALPATTRVRLNGDVVDALLAAPAPDPFRVLHHAVEAGDDATVLTFAPLAARDAQRAGAYRQEAACHAHLLARDGAMSVEQQAALHEAYSWALSNSNQLPAAAHAAERAVALWSVAGEGACISRALITLSRQQFLTERTSDALASARCALEQAAAEGDTTDHALARMNLGGVLVLLDREEEGLAVLEDALALAERAGARGVVSLCHNYIGSARLQLGELAGRDDLLRAVDLARGLANQELAMRAYYNLVEGSWRLGRFTEALEYVDRADHFTPHREVDVYGYMIEARQWRMAAMHGRWTEAVAGLNEMLDGQDDPGMIARETLPILARLLVRIDDSEAEQLLDEAVRHARRADVLEWLVPTGLAVIERAWLLQRPELAGSWPELLLERTDRAGTSWLRAELLRYLARLGRAVTAFPDCPSPYAEGLRGDWAAAAAGWEALGDPYERALELAESGDPDATMEAFHVLDSLGAAPAARLVRRRLRTLGVTRVVRRPAADNLDNPAGLTARQLEIVRLLGEGLSNADIAHLLVVSPRTVDRHVASVFQKLDVHNRRDAVAAARSRGLADPRLPA
jgi:DNA-binding CsgD family transcriptional regulator/tetratricopeptide (TPR) repeat protein